MKFINQRRYSYIPYPQCTDQPDDPYGKNGTVRSGGCGLCSTCMVVDHLTTEEFSVRECTELSIATGANHGDGTDMHILGPVVAEKFNLDFKKTNDINEVVKALHNGGGRSGNRHGKLQRQQGYLHEVWSLYRIARSRRK